MADSHKMIFAGFGGQGVLFAGKMVANAGLVEDRQLSWLPSYGPEMRGGTASCSVCLSDDPIGSPMVTNPNVLVAMNQPSLDKFYPSMAEGGIIVYDKTMIPNAPEAEKLPAGVRVFGIEASKIAEENKLSSNVILVGKLFAETHFCKRETLEKVVDMITTKRPQLKEPNMRALLLGENA